MLPKGHFCVTMATERTVSAMSEGMAQRIRQLRKEKKLTLEQVARAVGVEKSTVRKWETGAIANMRWDKLASLARALDTTTDDLMGSSEPDIPYSEPLPAKQDGFCVCADTVSVGFIGAGNMGGALAKAAAKAIGAHRILLSNRTIAKTEALADELGANAADNETIALGCDYIFLGVKPHMMENLLHSLQPWLQQRNTPCVLISMAAGLTIAAIERMTGLLLPVIRIMPNTACAVGEGLTLYDCSARVTPEQKDLFLHILSASGQLEALDEHLIDAGSAVAGCGGAFASLFMEALADGAVVCGLPRDKAMRYAQQMLLGAAKLALEGGQHPAQMKDAVCSPGGTTIAGVRALEEAGFRGAAMNAGIAAYERTLELKQ